ncbi:MAG: hypothetical protein AAB518_02470, partial [Patescibacteria group bacterium]
PGPSSSCERSPLHLPPARPALRDAKLAGAPRAALKSVRAFSSEIEEIGFSSCVYLSLSKCPTHVFSEFLGG